MFDTDFLFLVSNYQFANLLPPVCLVQNLYMHFLLGYPTGSPSVTNLTVNNQSRTLTCTSTGGPATTVTWRRDGAVITLNATYQQTKRVVDTYWGTSYQTVLTIDPSVDVVGTYNCTVENARGMSSKLYPIAGSGELMIPYKYYLRVTGYSACT